MDTDIDAEFQAWLDTPDGKEAAQPDILKGPEMLPFLINRLRAAFYSGKVSKP